jgi:hypothetical protein
LFFLKNKCSKQKKMEGIMLQIGYLRSYPVYLVPADKFFYCRHCLELSRCKNHRRGIFFRVNVILGEDVIKCFIFGQGEFEGSAEFFSDFDFGEVIRVGMSGCVKRTNSYTTSGGWTSISPQEVKVDPSKVSVEMGVEEQIVFSKLVLENVWFVLSLIKDWGIQNFRFTEEYMYLTPLLKIWKRARLISLPFGAFVKEIPFTFRAVLDFYPYKFSFVKKSRYNIGDWGDFAKFENCYFNEVMGRRTIYLERSYGRLVGFESYGDFKHPRCEVNSTGVSLYKLFNNRLGDLLFLEGSAGLEPATREQVVKLEILRGELVEEEGKLYVRGESEIILYHGEHGVLKLGAGVYQVYRVPYIIRGHD